MASRGEEAVKKAENYEMPQKSKDKKGINKVVVENMTSLLEQLLFQSGLSKRDSQAILSKLFVSHSPPFNTTPPKNSQTNKTENEAEYYYLKNPKDLHSP